ncbi:MAG: transcription antitermination factor NusB [Rhodocyclaceae bacterium]|jgi:N utilization substance protein B|nr:transcription antitermination factor NusB [Rhodocyclaceae bacterium]
MSSKNARRRGREFALQGIYHWLLNPGSGFAAIESHLAQAAGFDKADQEIFISRLRGTVGNANSLDAAIAPFMERQVNELSPVEHAVLLLAAQELTHHLEVPYRVVINEAIELTKEYGGTDGHRFVNGVLDKLAAQVRATEVEAAAKARKAP